MRYRQGPEQDRIDETEDGRVRPDADGERQHGHDGESGRPAKIPQCVLEVLAQGIDPAEQGLPSRLFLVIGVAAELGLRPGKLLHRELLVMAELLFQFPVEVAAPEARAERVAQRVEETHARPRTREMASERPSKAEIFWPRRLRPEAVKIGRAHV